MNNSVMVDHSFFKALLCEDDQYHQHAIELAVYLDSYQLYMTDKELIKCMDITKNMDNDIKNDFFRLITAITQILYIRQNNIYDKIINIYTDLNGVFSFSECINIYFLKFKKFNAYVSYDSRYDMIKNVTRIHNVGENDEILKMLRYKKNSDG